MPEIDGSYLVAKTLKEAGTECLFYLMGGPNYVRKLLLKP